MVSFFVSCLCCKTVNCGKRFRKESHRSSTKHKRLSNRNCRSQYTNAALHLSSKKDFKCKLVEAFLAADINLYKRPNYTRSDSCLKDFGQQVPSESSCCAHVDKLVADVTKLFKEHFVKDIFLVVDKSEVGGSKYYKVLIGNISVEEMVN